MIKQSLSPFFLSVLFLSFFCTLSVSYWAAAAVVVV